MVKVTLNPQIMTTLPPFPAGGQSITRGGLRLLRVKCTYQANVRIRKLEGFCSKSGAQNLVVGGDVNAKSLWWGCRTCDHRGEGFCCFLDAQSWGKAHFSSQQGIVDVTVCSKFF